MKIRYLCDHVTKRLEQISKLILMLCFFAATCEITVGKMGSLANSNHKQFVCVTSLIKLLQSGMHCFTKSCAGGIE